MTTIIVEIPGDPKPKGRVRFTKTSDGALHVRQWNYTPETTRAYENVVRSYAKDAMRGRSPFVGAVSVKVIAYKPLLKSFTAEQRLAALDGRLLPDVKPDVDNYGKLALDALNGVVYADDKQVVRLTLEKCYGAESRLWIEAVEL